MLCYVYDIDSKFYKVRSLLKVFKDNYSFYFPYNFDMFRMCIDFCHGIARNEVDKVNVRLHIKFQKLFKESPWFSFSNLDNVVNLSDFNFSPEQLCFWLWNDIFITFKFGLYFTIFD